MKAGPGYPLFWIPLIKTYMMNISRDRVILLALIADAGSLMVPVRFAFSYTQAVLFAGMSIDQLLLAKRDKGFEYALWPLSTVMPNGMFSWIESLTCTSTFLTKTHGHIIYDTYMASSYIIFYPVCWIRMKHRYKSKAKANCSC